MGLAYFPFYPGDWLSSQDVQTMTLEEQGAYLRLLCYMWKTDDCTLPKDTGYLCRLLAVQDTDLVARLISAVMTETGDNKITNKRLAEEHKRALDTYQKQVDGGIKRAKSMWGKKKKATRSPNRSPIANTDRSPIANQNQNQNQKGICCAPPKLIHLRYVLLTPDEHKKLVEKLNGSTDAMIERLDSYIGQIGVKKAAKYVSHYDTILNWWRKDNPKPEEKAPYVPKLSL